MWKQNVYAEISAKLSEKKCVVITTHTHTHNVATIKILKMNVVFFCISAYYVWHDIDEYIMLCVYTLQHSYSHNNKTIELLESQQKQKHG